MNEQDVKTAEQLRELLGEIKLVPNSPHGVGFKAHTDKLLEDFRVETADGVNSPIVWISSSGDLFIDTLSLVQKFGNYPGAMSNMVDRLLTIIAPFMHSQESRDSAFEQLRSEVGVDVLNAKTFKEIEDAFESVGVKIRVIDDISPQLVDQDGKKIIH